MKFKFLLSFFIVFSAVALSAGAQHMNGINMRTVGEKKLVDYAVSIPSVHAFMDEFLEDVKSEKIYKLTHVVSLSNADYFSLESYSFKLERYVSYDPALNLFYAGTTENMIHTFKDVKKLQKFLLHVSGARINGETEFEAGKEYDFLVEISYAPVNSAWYALNTLSLGLFNEKITVRETYIAH